MRMVQVERAQTRAIADALVWLSERAFDGRRSWATALDALEAQFDAEDSCLDTLLQVPCSCACAHALSQSVWSVYDSCIWVSCGWCGEA